uniref:Uncharacterized protein n=1 Tax=Anguilla anguilla TaxID=7936 RepID=A0A0E9PRI0_ANGAN
MKYFTCKVHLYNMNSVVGGQWINCGGVIFMC